MERLDGIGDGLALRGIEVFHKASHDWRNLIQGVIYFSLHGLGWLVGCRGWLVTTKRT